jgi:hypothetical protein
MLFFSPSEVSEGRNDQGMLLSHFAHADGSHLLFNMLTLSSVRTSVYPQCFPRRLRVGTKQPPPLTANAHFLFISLTSF